MKIVWIFYLMGAFICMMIFSCSCSSHKAYKKKNFDSLINIVERNHSKMLDGTEELIADTAFKEIFEHSQVYFDDVMNLLSKKDIDQRRAYYCVFAMQNLELNDY